MDEEENFQKQPISVEETSQKKGGNKMRKIIWGLLAVAVLALVAIGWGQTDTSTQGEGVGSISDEWKYDLTEIGLPVLHYVPSSFRDDDTSTAFVSGTYAAEEGECQIFYRNQLNPRESVLSQEAQDGDYYFQFFNALFQCVSPEPESWGVRFANIDAYIMSYRASCGDLSLSPFGWTGDPEIDDLSCVPAVFEFLN